MSLEITDDIDALIDVLPPEIALALRQADRLEDLLEVVLDLGRPAMRAMWSGEVRLIEREMTQEEIDDVVSRIGDFGDDNRAGIERTLHRISAIRNRRGRVIGLTCRVGRAVYGTIDIIRDIVESGKSILLLGRPGVGKTTMLREVARVLAENKRVIIVDTSNEIGGDGDIPHPAVGRRAACRCPRPSLQHAVMIEAVENHMPEVIVIDEIGTELEAAAARTIAERGVQLVGTAHGNTLDNLMMNPTLCDLVGGIQTVTLSDEEARRRGTQKSVLERKAPPTFDVVVEIQDWDRVAVREDVADGGGCDPARAHPARRDSRAPGHRARSKRSRPSNRNPHAPREEREAPARRARLARHMRGEATLRSLAHLSLWTQPEPRAPGQPPSQRAGRAGERINEADALFTLRTYYRKRPQVIADAERRGIPMYVLRNNTASRWRPTWPRSLASTANEPDTVSGAGRDARGHASR